MNTSNKKYFKNTNPKFQREAGEKFREKYLEEKILEMKNAIAKNIGSLNWVTKAEYKTNEDKIFYNIKKGIKAEKECRNLKFGMKVFLEKYYGDRDDLITELHYKIEDEQKGIYSISLEITADKPDEAFYKVASELNKGLTNYLAWQ